MKKIEAIIKPFKLDEVKEALQAAGLQGITSPRRRVLVARRVIRNSIAAPNMSSISSQGEIEIVLADDAVERAVEAIRKAAQTGA